MKKLLSLLLAALMAAALFAGCGAQATDSYNGMEMGEMVQEDLAEPGDGIYGRTDSSTAESTQYKDQKLIKNVELRTETEDLDALLPQLTDKINALGGYTEFQNVFNGSAYGYYRSRSAELTVRIPADKLDGFLTDVEGFSNVISRTESVDDVTLQYVDTQGRMEALQAEHDRLVELMEKAENLSDLLTIEERLTDVRYELESVTSRLRVLDNQVSYATIKLYIDEVEVLTDVEEPSVWQRISTGFVENLKDVGDALVDLFVWIVTYSPQLLILAGVVTLVIWLCRRALRSRKPRKSPYAQPKPQPPEEKPE